MTVCGNRRQPSDLPGTISSSVCGRLNGGRPLSSEQSVFHLTDKKCIDLKSMLTHIISAD